MLEMRKIKLNTRKFGIIGEKIAQGYLKTKNYEILKTNFYTKRGEIDIIAKQENCIVFVEVKTRSNLEYGTPAMAVNGLKKKHLKSSARIYLYQNRLDKYDIRFDVIEIIINSGKCKINHIEGIMK